MFVKIANKSVDLSIELYDRQSPLACRFLQQQLAAGAWKDASITGVDGVAVLGVAEPQTLKLAKTKPPKFDVRGLVAYARDSDREIIINLGSPFSAGPLIGKLSARSEAELQTYLQKGSGPPRKKVRPYAEPLASQDSQPSAQLLSVLDFEKRLASFRRASDVNFE